MTKVKFRLLERGPEGLDEVSKLHSHRTWSCNFSLKDCPGVIEVGPWDGVGMGEVGVEG